MIGNLVNLALLGYFNMPGFSLAIFSGLKTGKSGRSLWSRFSVPPVTKADTWATTILFDEHYARGLQRPADGKFIGSGNPRSLGRGA